MNDLMKHVDSKLIEMLNESQDYAFDTELGVRVLKNLIDIESLTSTDPDENQKLKEKIAVRFVRKFCGCLEELLVLKVADYANAALIVKFVIEILVQFSSANKNEKFVRDEILCHLIRHHRANSDQVRLRICQLLNKFLNALQIRSTVDQMDSNNNNTQSYDGGGELDEKLFLKLRACLIERVRDVQMNVQVEAITAISYLQTPNDRFCPVINAFIYLLRHDSMPQIRCLVLDMVAINDLTYDLIRNELIYDTNREIRTKSMRLILRKVSSRHVDAKLRWMLVDCLLNDHNYELLEEFVDKWLVRRSNRIKKFIADLDFYTCWLGGGGEAALEITIEKFNGLMRIVYDLKSLPYALDEFSEYEENLLKDFNSVLYLHSMINYALETDQMNSLLQSQQKVFQPSVLFNELIERLKVNDDVECLLIDRFRGFMLFYLFECAYHLEKNSSSSNDDKCFDDDKLLLFTNEMLENELRFTEYHLLTVKSILLKVNTTDQRLKLFVAVWNHYKYHEDGDVESVKRSLSVLIALLIGIDSEATASTKDYEDLLSYGSFDLEPANLNDMDDDENEILQQQFNLDASQTLPEFVYKNILLQTISSQDPVVRALTIRAMGLMSILDPKVAELCFDIFFKAVHHDFPVVLIEAEKALFNILFTYPSQVLSENKEAVEKIVTVLFNQMDCLNNSEIRFCAYEGFAKLLLKRSIENDDVTFKIFLTFCATAGTDQQQQQKQKQQLLDGDAEDSSDQQQDRAINNRLQKCLNIFLKEYFRLNPLKLPKIVTMYLNYALRKNLSLKKMIKYVCYLTSTFENVFYKHLIISTLLERVIENFNDFKYLQRLVECLIEFKIGSADIEQSSEDYQIERLEQIVDDFRRLIGKLKAEKWKLTKEDELKKMAAEIISLCSSSKFKSTSQSRGGHKRTSSAFDDHSLESKKPKL